MRLAIDSLDSRSISLSALGPNRNHDYIGCNIDPDYLSSNESAIHPSPVNVCSSYR